ncbi:MAG: hypothetical protein H7A51_03975 [Akkermansiaceae bacterium]|nr:hypothetical protein [Akkermansiaceae bacterium]
MSNQPIFSLPKATDAPERSIEREAAILRSAVLSDAREGYRRLCQIQKQGIKRIWNHPRLTPQQAVDALGIDAARIFQAHGALTQVIAAVAALDEVESDLQLPTHEFTMNPDGTVTVGEGPYQPAGD